MYCSRIENLPVVLFGGVYHANLKLRLLGCITYKLGKCLAILGFTSGSYHVV